MSGGKMRKITSLFICLIIALFGIAKGGTLYSQPYTSVRAAHILVEDEAQAKELKKRIENGEKFEALAQKYSLCPSKENGGDLGYFTKHQMVKPFEDAAFQTEVGQISDPVKTQFGWHLIKVYDKK